MGQQGRRVHHRMFRRRWYLVWCLSLTQYASTYTLREEGVGWTRRDCAKGILATFPVSFAPMPSTAVSGDLAERLNKRDPAVLVNSVFNVPPKAQIYPEFMRGTWDIESKFGGFLFPSKKIPKEKIISNYQIPGFQKCSIASISDVGKDVTYKLKFDPKSGLEDRSFNLPSQIGAYLGYDAVSNVIYDAISNPNRISIDFQEYRTRNAERIELFCNARESEIIDENIFLCSEYIRQVTFGTGTERGIPRQVAGNYAHFYTWRKNEQDRTRLSGNILTAAYLDPQDPLFFDEPSKPVAVYSHILSATREN